MKRSPIEAAFLFVRKKVIPPQAPSIHIHLAPNLPVDDFHRIAFMSIRERPRGLHSFTNAHSWAERVMPD